MTTATMTRHEALTAAKNANTLEEANYYYKLANDIIAREQQERDEQIARDRAAYFANRNN